MDIPNSDGSIMRQYVQNSGEDSSPPEKLGIEIESTNHDSAADTHQSDKGYSGIVSGSSAITTKDLKFIHAEILVKIVQAGISRSPPKLGELLAALKSQPGFDPGDHNFEHLPRDFFLDLSTADLELCAWNFIDPKKAPAAISALRRSRDTIPTNDSHVASSSSVKRKKIETFVPAGDTIHGDTLVTTPSCQQSQYQKLAGFSNSYPATCHQSLNPRVNTFVPTCLHRPKVQRDSASSQDDQSSAASPRDARRPSYLNLPQDSVPPTYGWNPYGAVYTGVYTPFGTYQAASGMRIMQMTARHSPPKSLPVHIPFNTSRSRQGIVHVASPDTLRRITGGYLSINPNYKGEINDHAIQNASCSSWENCSIHVEGFSPFESQKEMLSIVQHARVAALNRHDPHPRRYPMAAADFTFFDRASAENFMQRGGRGMISAHGHPLTFKWNKNKALPATPEECRQSRTLLITGPEKTITLDTIMSVLEGNLTFELVDSEEEYIGKGRTLLRLEFSQIRGQSRPAMKCIYAYKDTDQLSGVEVNYEL